MEDLLIAIARGLVDDKDAVKVTADEPNEEGIVVYHLNVASDDMGRVIGKQAVLRRRCVRLCAPALAASVRRSWLKSTDSKSRECS